MPGPAIRIPVRLRWAAAGVAVVLAYGVTGYTLLGFPFVDALFQTVLALTTLGFAPARPLTTGQKFFTVSLAVVGASMFLVIVALLTSAVVEGRIGIWSRRRRMERRIASLRDHFIICAYGRVGRAVAREFEGEGIPFVVLDRDQALEEQMRLDGVVFALGDPTSDVVLRRAGIEHARGLISAVDSDADNVYITLTARSLNPSLFIVARASEPGSPDRLYRAGADRVISPYVTSGRHMALLALRPRVIDYLEVARGGDRKLRLEELLVEEGSSLIGKSIGDAAGDATALLLQRADGATVASPGRDTALRGGDLIVLVGEPRTLRGFEGG
jgi:voltage-gated potassium channel